VIKIKISVVITLFEDIKVLKTLTSLKNQSVTPDEIIIADGGSEKEFIDTLTLFIKNGNIKNNKVLFKSYPGNICQTRFQVIDNIKTDIIVFIDSDEVAPNNWLEKLTKPIREGKADFTGGKTKPISSPTSKYEKFVNNFDDWCYENIVKYDMTANAMGNSSYSMKIFDKIGNFDRRLIDSEDFDINIRAVKAGFKGMYVEDAWVWHNQARINTFWKLITRKYRYSVGSTIVYLKHKDIKRRSKKAVKTSLLGYKHPFEFIFIFVKGIAFVKGYIDWRKKFCDNN
jgi:glycosyltransferase involved in cell wall biosynthesis